ncbi:hypothetical protein IL306_014961, partial [Fusarium sp. DS 682]
LKSAVEACISIMRIDSLMKLNPEQREKTVRETLSPNTDRNPPISTEAYLDRSLPRPKPTSTEAYLDQSD